jgi:hypothetical protein
MFLRSVPYIAEAQAGLCSGRAGQQIAALIINGIWPEFGSQVLMFSKNMAASSEACFCHYSCNFQYF